MLNIYKNSNKNNNDIISQRKIVLINIKLISTIAEWESEYKQYIISMAEIYGLVHTN